ncbi:MAG: PspC domain-containing protein [Acidaminobacter sp.]|uniref:PspC domain-containing protein n=1 Tax=Acidaminobacter sp. TaxID=1872102 RepID=UPI00137C4645|nr:PspC domain-containing protein [Acidaminobacter sp.]
MEKKLYRSRENRMLFGVCGGIGEYTGIDPTVIRLGMIFIGFTCIGVLFYIAAGLIIPEAPLSGRGTQGPGSGPGSGGGRSRREEETFDPVAGAKPDMPSEMKTEMKTDAGAEVSSASQPSSGIGPEAGSSAENFDYETVEDEIAETAVNASEPNKPAESATKEV